MNDRRLNDRQVKRLLGTRLECQANFAGSSTANVRALLAHSRVTPRALAVNDSRKRQGPLTKGKQPRLSPRLMILKTWIESGGVTQLTPPLAGPSTHFSTKLSQSSEKGVWTSEARSMQSCASFSVTPVVSTHPLPGHGPQLLITASRSSVSRWRRRTR
jgi:hypothetical protein